MNFLELLPFVHEGNVHIYASLLVVLVLFGVAYSVYKRTRKPETCIIPEKKTSVTNAIEVMIEFFSDKAREIIGEGGEKYVPFIGTLFLYVLLSNLMGLVPGFIPPSENMNMILSCGLIVFVSTHYFGIREHGFKYVKKFMAPVSGIFGIFLSVIFFPIEIFSNIFRPMSLSIRLFGNINGDHTVMNIFATQIPLLKAFPMVVPVAFLLLGLLVAVIQAFIFSLLSMIYISLAVSHEH